MAKRSPNSKSTGSVSASPTTNGSKATGATSTVAKRPLTEEEMDARDAAEALRRIEDPSDGTTSLDDLRNELGI